MGQYSAGVGPCDGCLYVSVVAPAWIEALALAADGRTICAGLQSGEIVFYTLVGADSRGWASVPAPAVAPDASDENHEALLRRGLDVSRREKGPDHEETLAHVAALAVHLERMRKTRSQTVKNEHDEVALRVVARKLQEESSASEPNTYSDDTEFVKVITSEIGRSSKSRVKSRKHGTDLGRRSEGPDREEILASFAALAAQVAIRDGARNQSEPLDRVSSYVDMERRAIALRAYQAGDYAHAERLLQSLIMNRFEIPSTHCHLGQIFLIQDRLAEAAVEIEAAWEHRAEAPSYIVPRILWMQLMLLYFTSGEAARTNGAQVILGRLKTALARDAAHMKWAMDPVLAHLQPKLPAEQYQLLAVLVAALNEAANLLALEQFPAWRDASAEPLE